MVPLVGGEGAEVKTLVVGEGCLDHEGEAHVEHLSYCSRLTDVPGGERARRREIPRRGLERAEPVAAVTDGAEWVQGFLSSHRADAVRLLDVPHAAEDVNAIGEAARAAGHPRPEAGLKGVWHRLKHEGPQRVLRHLEALCTRCPDPEVRKKLQDLRTRQAQMAYPAFRSAGWPSGSGRVERANTLVVAARLKGAGRHGKRENGNAMLLVRHAVCNDRWDETWQGRMKQAQQSRKQEREHHTRVRVMQATQRLLRLWFPLVLCKPHRNEPAASTVSSSPAPAPKGRTEAQDRWGRRPVSPRGARIQAGFAKL